jgi:THO complex subunit 2
VSLLHALLAVGSIPAALQLLSLHPQISGPYQFISDGIHRILHISIDKVYAPYSPSRQFDQFGLEKLGMQKRRAVTNRAAGAPLEWISEMERKSVRGYSPLPKQEFGDRTVRFFLDDDLWTDDIPICETMDDFYAIAINFLRFSGARVGNDVSLLVKLARLGKVQFLNVKSHFNWRAGTNYG